MLSLDITLQRGDFALRVEAEFPSGATMVFGPSGAGKTTLVKAVAGLLRPEAGRIVLNGRTLFDAQAGVHIPPRARRIGYVFQEPRLFPHLTVAQNLSYGAGAGADMAEIVELLEIGALLEAKPLALSGGQAQRVALGRALLTNPDVLILDEPLAALDHRLKAEILPYFERLRDQARVPMLYVTHALNEVLAIGSSLLVLEDGQVAMAGPLQDALVSPEAHRLLGADSAGVSLAATRKTTEALWQTSLGPFQANKSDSALQAQIRIMAQDVILAEQGASGIKAALCVPASVEDVTPLSSNTYLVRLSVGADMLLAEVDAGEALALEKGQSRTAFIRRYHVRGHVP